MDSETDVYSESDYNALANEIPFVGNILHLFQFESIFTSAKLARDS